MKTKIKGKDSAPGPSKIQTAPLHFAFVCLFDGRGLGKDQDACRPRAGRCVLGQNMVENNPLGRWTFSPFLLLVFCIYHIAPPFLLLYFRYIINLLFSSERQ